MEITLEKYKHLIRGIMARFKELETELVAHEQVLHGLMLLGIDRQSVEQSLQIARASPLVVGAMNQKYDKPLEELLAKLDHKSNLEQSFLELLRSWRPQGPLN